MLQNLNFHKMRILVLGDIMLDKYWHGETSRISPEAPVPIVKVQTVDERPGGAANVALNIKALGATPYLLGITGIDESADALSRILAEKGVAHHFIQDKALTTITKLRILSHHHQMIRLDREASFASFSKVALLQAFAEQLDTVDAVILSDYGKGTLNDAVTFIALARKKNLLVIVDPKAKDFSVYQGATVITPNLKEFEEVVGASPSMTELVYKGQENAVKNNIETFIVTRSEQGLSVIPKVGEATHIPALAKEVHDVTGAGDTVVAVLSVALAAGADLVTAAKLSNLAAGIVVGKLGAAVVTLQELQAALAADQSLPLGMMNTEHLLSAVRLAKAKGERIVFTNGCFDLLHAGHVMYLEQAKRLGDKLIVAVNTDASVARLKGPTRPINSLEARMSVLAALKAVDWVVSFAEDTPEALIQEIAPHLLVKGGDYQDIHTIPGAQFVLTQGGKVQLLGLREGVSTTKLIEKINTKNEEKVLL
jgi:D-beta-D-heptose 7-phosphate kinase/D-beta-D-heptose 1-phosphate adenosyltransferase